MTALTLPAVDAQAVAARYLGPARAYIRAMHGDETLTYGQVEEQALRTADMPALRAAIDDAVNDARADERHKASVEVRRLCHENGRLRGRIVGLIATIRNARNVGEPGWAAVAIGNALLALESSTDDDAATLNDFEAVARG